MRDPIGLREQRGEHAKLCFGEAKRPDLLLEHHRHLTPDMQQEPAQQNARGRQIGHAGFEVLEICLDELELRFEIIHLHTNYLIHYILASEYLLRNYQPVDRQGTARKP
jgi:hypothetical protein